MLSQLCACGLEIAFLDCGVSLGSHLGELLQSPPSPPPPDIKVSSYMCKLRGTTRIGEMLIEV